MKVIISEEAKKDFVRLGFAKGQAEDWKEWLEMNIWWPIEKVINIPFNLYEDIKAFIQRGKRGYADRDCWGIDWYLCEWLPDALRKMVDENNHGGNSYPGEPWGSEADTIEHWKATVNKIARGFEAHKTLKDEFINYTSIKGKKLVAEHKEGMRLFSKYFGHLWD